jgi:hypothetical protein
VIIRESSLDTNASATVIRMKLSKLDEYMPVVKSNIKAFNMYVKLQLKMLTVHGETTNDLLVHLFVARKRSTRISAKKPSAKSSCMSAAKPSRPPRQLMATMEQYWEVLVEKGEWDAPDKDEQRLMVMKAELGELKICKQAQPKGKPFKGKTKDAKMRVPDPEWLAKNIKPSPIDKIAHHRGAPWYWCSPETRGKGQVRWLLAQAQAGRMHGHGTVHDIGPVHFVGKDGCR